MEEARNLTKMASNTEAGMVVHAANGSESDGKQTPLLQKAYQHWNLNEESTIVVGSLKIRGAVYC